MIFGNEVVDLSPIFSVAPQNNYMLNALNVFDGVPSDTPKIVISDIVTTNESLLNTPKSRYSSEHDVTKRDFGTDRIIEIPFYHREDMVKVSDIQGKRKFGTELEQTLLDVSSDYVARHAIAYYRTREKAFAQALFAGTVTTPYTDDQLIDWSTTFDATRMTKVIDLTSTTVNPFEMFDEIIDATNEKADGLMSKIERVVVFATPAFYNALRYSAQFATAFQYVLPQDPANVVFQRRELLPNVSFFSIPGTNIDIVKVSDPLLSQFIPDNSAIAIPVFSAGANVYQNVYGPASTRFDLMNQSASEYYTWQMLRERGDALDIVTEHSTLPVNHGFGFSTLITQS
ncbi:major capsid protein [Klebsiella grimontii]|uniref:major capsid protein n=1 Tax=Klebsiella grimontii TaxID=2058152 RepID=UPI0012B8606A|nr:major capsid protein [Klebsiella grimontii]MCS0529633.1 major capsid protein [Klebsiella grimontii]